MKKFALAPLLLLFSATVLSQTARPTPPAEKEDDVVKISTTLIQLDVTVTDWKGNVVTDLKPEDFEIYENGEKQPISNFSFVSNVRTLTEQPNRPNGQAPLPAPRTELRPEKVRRTIALVVDDLSLSFQSVYYVRRALKKFVDEQMQEGDLVAIIRTGAGIGALQQFTGNRQQLYAAIEKVKWNPVGRGGIGAFAPIRDSEKIENELESEEMREARENSENAIEDFRGSVFATGTLGALRFIVGGMKGLPGRKSVMLFSDGFKILQRNESGFSEGGRVLEFLRQLIDQANRSAVVFYTIDPRGLQPTGLTAEDDVRGTAERIQQVLSERSAELFDTQQGLIYLAQQTGGFAHINNNDVSAGVRRVLEDQSYYLIGYEPDADTFDAKTRRFNNLEVKVKRKNLKVRYRSGFFNVATENASKTASDKTPAQQILAALTSPFAVNEVSLKLNALFGVDDKQMPFVRSLLHVDAKDLKFTEQTDGAKKASFTVLAINFGDNGVPVDQIGESYTLTVKKEEYEQLLKEGFVYYFTFPVKKPGAYQYRVALRDSEAGTVGSASQYIEVPNLKKERLTLSGVVLENLSLEQWKNLSSETTNLTEKTGAKSTDPMTDTALRRFRRGTVLRYGVEIYNARLDGSKKPNLSVQARVFRDGEVLLDGKPTPLETGNETDFRKMNFSRALNLAAGMRPGDYILQIIVTDHLAKEKRRIAAQVVQFEIIE